MGILSRAASKIQVTETKKSKGCTWNVGDHKRAAEVDKAINDYVELDRQIKTLEGKQTPAKNLLKNVCDELFFRDFAALGVLPDTPMTLLSTAGEKVTFVVQDRCGSSKVKDEQVEQLTAEFGPDAVGQMVGEVMTFKFNPILAARPDVMEVLDKHLSAAIEELTAPRTEGTGKNKKSLPPVLTAEQAEMLVEADKKVSFIPGTVARLASLVGAHAARIKMAAEIMAGACVRYVKS